MAGDWIKMQKSLPRDPRVVRISSALKADRLRTVGGLFSAWCLFDEQTGDGKLEGYTVELFDEIVGMPGLALAMESVGWLAIGDGFLEVPRFDEHNGKSSKRRLSDNVRKMSARKADKCPQTVRTKSGPEKRREEYIERERETPEIEIEVAHPKNPNPGTGTRRPTLDQAKSAASTIGVSPEKADEWWHAREASEWLKGMAGGGTAPVGSNWQADLKTYASRGSQGHQGSFPGGQNGNSPKPQTKLDWE